MLTKARAKFQFKVPQGVCVTTEAYKDFVLDPVLGKALDDLELVCAGGSMKEIREACNRYVSSKSNSSKIVLTALPK